MMGYYIMADKNPQVFAEKQKAYARLQGRGSVLRQSGGNHIALGLMRCPPEEMPQNETPESGASEKL